MPTLPLSLRAWASPPFAQTLKEELQQLAPGALPLTQAVANGGFVDDRQLTVTVIAVADADNAIRARVGVFFTEIIVNCGCGDEPMPTPAYCELQVTIDKASGAAAFAPLPD